MQTYFCVEHSSPTCLVKYGLFYRCENLLLSGSKIKPHTPHRYNRIVVLNYCAVCSLYNARTSSYWKIISVSHLEADLETASVQHLAENYLSLCRQRTRYQYGDHNLRHTYISVIDVCTILGRSLARAVSRTAEDPSRNQVIKIYGGQSGTRTGSRQIRRISPVGIIAPVLRVHPSSVTET